MNILVNNFRLSQPLEHVFITQPFGANDVSFYVEGGLKGHPALDYRAVSGTPCFAVIDGVVTGAGQDWQGGRFVKYETDPVEIDGTEWKLEFLYYHLQEWHVIAGERVWRGQPIGLTDNTGRYTTAPHLHFAVTPWWKENGLWLKDSHNGYQGSIDPEPLFTYMPDIHNPYGIPENTLVQLTEGRGGFALWSEGKMFIDDLDKILASWMVRNKGRVENKVLAVAQVVWDAYKDQRFNLKREPLT